MSKQVIDSVDAPQAIGPYSQAIKVGNMIYFSGQIPLDPKTMSLIPGDFKAQAVQAFKNLQAISKAAGGNLENIVKLTIYLTDLENFTTVNEVMKQIFVEPFPARTTIVVSDLPKMAQIEVEAIMLAR